MTIGSGPCSTCGAQATRRATGYINVTLAQDPVDPRRGYLQKQVAEVRLVCELHHPEALTQMRDIYEVAGSIPLSWPTAGPDD